MDVFGFNQETSKALYGVAQSYRLTGAMKAGATVGDFDWSQGNVSGFWYLQCTTEISAATSDTIAGTGKGVLQQRKRDVNNSNEFESTGNEIEVFNRLPNKILVDDYFFASRSLDGTIWVVTPTIIPHGIIRLTIGADFTDTDSTFTGTVAKSQVAGVSVGDTITVSNYIKGTGANGDPALVYVYPDGSYDLVAHACV